MHFHLHADGSESRAEMRRNAYVADDVGNKQMRIKLSKCQFAFVVLLVATIIYAVALVVSVQAYEVWKDRKLSEYPSVIRGYIDFPSFFFSSFGQPYVILGIGLMLCWMSLGLGWVLIGGSIDLSIE